MDLLRQGTAGAVFDDVEGELRLVWGMVAHWVRGTPDTVDIPGVLVQECVPDEDEDGFELTGCHWETLCPLVDLPDLYPRLVNRLPSLRG